MCRFLESGNKTMATYPSPNPGTYEGLVLLPYRSLLALKETIVAIAPEQPLPRGLALESVVSEAWACTNCSSGFDSVLLTKGTTKNSLSKRT